MKKIIGSLLIVVILFNFILCNNSYATDELMQSGGISSYNPTEDENASSTGSVWSNLTDGVISLGGGFISLVLTAISTLLGAIVGVIVAVLNTFPMLIQLAMIFAARTGQGIYHRRCCF